MTILPLPHFLLARTRARVAWRGIENHVEQAANRSRRN